MVVTTDIGDAPIIHPRNKQEVGRRLSLAARAATQSTVAPASGRHFVSRAGRIPGATKPIGAMAKLTCYPVPLNRKSRRTPGWYMLEPLRPQALLREARGMYHSAGQKKNR